MRDIKRIDLFCGALAEQWKRKPELRFWEIMNYVFDKAGDCYNFEEFEILKYIISVMDEQCGVAFADGLAYNTLYEKLMLYTFNEDNNCKIRYKAKNVSTKTNHPNTPAERRIDLFCNVLAEQWKRENDFRFGQLIIGVSEYILIRKKHYLDTNGREFSDVEILKYIVLFMDFVCNDKFNENYYDAIYDQIEACIFWNQHL